MPTNQASRSAPPATSATFCPETARRWNSPEARKSSRRSSDRPSSSPSTTPARTARRSPPRPGAIEREIRARRRSAKPATPPRRPTARHRSARTITCTPRRRSHVRSSKPSSGPRGARISPITSMRAPCGGERAGGKRRSTGSRSSRLPNRRTSAGMRSENSERRPGPVIARTNRPACPISGASALRSIASRRALAHDHPLRRSAPHTRTWTVAARASTAPAATASPASRSANAVARLTFALASPAQSAPRKACGDHRARRSLTAPLPP
jgi:hypothetical protein